MDREEYLRAHTIGELQPLADPIELLEYDPAWPAMYQVEAAQIRNALDHRALLLEHAGSTSVPGLVAKPILDIVLGVEDSAREEDYAQALEAAGYALRIREPEWHEHRMFRRLEPLVHLHVFSAGSPEIERMLLFRDWLRTCEKDRILYARTKRELAQQNWKYMQEYADAKSTVVEQILARARSARG